MFSAMNWSALSLVASFFKYRLQMITDSAIKNWKQTHFFTTCSFSRETFSRNGCLCPGGPTYSGPSCWRTRWANWWAERLKVAFDDRCW